MEPISPDVPFHTKYFDVIVLPTPALPNENNAPVALVQHSHECSPSQGYSMYTAGQAHTPQGFNTNSIMFYEDAILDAIKDLKDGLGSTLPAIKKHIQATFFSHQQHELEEKRKEQPRVQHQHQHQHHRRHMSVPGMPFHWYHQDPPHPPTPIASHASSAPVWRENLFLQALKSVLDKKCVVGADAGTEERDDAYHHASRPRRKYSYSDSSSIVRNGSTHYKLSQEYKLHHARELALRLWNLKQYKLAQDAKVRRAAKERRERAMSHVPPVTLKPIFRKRDLVPSQAVTIVNGSRVDFPTAATTSGDAASATPSPPSINGDSEGIDVNNNATIISNHGEDEGSFVAAASARKRTFVGDRMDVVRELQKDKRSALPHHPLHLHADDSATAYEFLRGSDRRGGGTTSTSDPDLIATAQDDLSVALQGGGSRKMRHPVSLRDKMKIPRHKILVKDIISKSRTLSI